MNRLVVRATTAGVAHWVLGQGAGAARRGIVVGRDARHGSDEFARDVAEVASRAGVVVRVFPRPLPTPLTAFAVKHLGAAAGVMVTASHNPAADNGYKVYMADGAQVIPPADAVIAEAASTALAQAIASPADPTPAPDAAARKLASPSTRPSYWARTAQGLRPARSAGPRRLRIVYTPLHGVGGRSFQSSCNRRASGRFRSFRAR